MGYLNEDNISKIELELTKKVVKMFDIDLRCLIYDTTNFFTWIDTASESELPQRGHNKAKRNDLKQVGLALMVTRDFHIPLFHKVYAGNVTDPKQFKTITDELVARYKEISSEFHDVTLVFDKGNNSKDAYKHLETSPFDFVSSLKPSHHTDLLKIPLSEYVPLEGAGFGGVSAYRLKKKVLGIERTVVVTYNEALYLGQMQGLVHQLRKANSSLRDLKRKLDERAKNPKPKGKKPTMESVEKQIKQILSADPLNKIIRYKLDQEHDNVTFSYEIDHEARKQHEVAHIYPNGSGQKDYYTLSEVSSLQQQIMDILEIVKVHQN